MPSSVLKGFENLLHAADPLPKIIELGRGSAAWRRFSNFRGRSVRSWNRETSLFNSAPLIVKLGTLRFVTVRKPCLLFSITELPQTVLLSPNALE
jgi:hypothetical protein